MEEGVALGWGIVVLAANGGPGAKEYMADGVGHHARRALEPYTREWKYCICVVWPRGQKQLAEGAAGLSFHNGLWEQLRGRPAASWARRRYCATVAGVTRAVLAVSVSDAPLAGRPTVAQHATDRQLTQTCGGRVRSEVGEQTDRWQTRYHLRLRTSSRMHREHVPRAAHSIP